MILKLCSQCIRF